MSKKQYIDEINFIITNFDEIDDRYFKHELLQNLFTEVGNFITKTDALDDISCRGILTKSVSLLENLREVCIDDNLAAGLTDIVNKYPDDTAVQYVAKVAGSCSRCTVC